MKKNLQKLLILLGKRGDSVILTVMVLLILFVFTASMLLIFSFWQKSSFKIMSGKKAYRFAKTGIEEAIWEIDKDNREVDSYLDSWRTSFEGKDIDLNEDGTPDSRWFYIKDRQGETVGRYAILVEDESGKININYAGSPHSKKASYTVQDIDILPNLLGKITSQNVATYRETRKFESPSDIKMVKGIGETTHEKIKNYITCFSYDLNRNRKDKERANINTAPYEKLYQLFLNNGYSQEVARQTVLNIIAYREKNKPLPLITIGNRDIIGVGKTPYLNEIDAVKPWSVRVLPSGVVILTEEGGQFIELFNPYETEIDIGGWEIKGVITLFSQQWKDFFDNSETILNDVTQGETYIDPQKNKGFWEKLVPTTIIIPKGKKIPPRSYYTIGDRISLKIIVSPGPPIMVIPVPIPIRDPSNCNQYEPILAINPGSLGAISHLLQYIPFLSNLGLDFRMRLFDSNGNIVENTTYIVDFPYTTVQKNDPRMNDQTDWYDATPSPGEQNIVFQPWIGKEFGMTDWVFNWPSHFNIRNSHFLSLGELSLIHKKQHWQTLDFWKYGKDRKMIDHLTTFKEPQKPTYGRLNINTSSETVLMCLPRVDKNLATAIVEARPYSDISEILGTRGSGDSPLEKLSREITKYGFDLKDNDKDTYIDTDKEKEIIFNDIINLITVRSNVFKIISIGQKVQNIEKNGKIVTEIESEKRVTVWYDRRKKKIIYRREIE